MFDKVNLQPNEFDSKVDTLLEEIASILKRKNKDYGGASFDLGIEGNYVHIHDKENRIRSLLTKNSKEINFESIEDTYKDLIGYAIIGLIIFEKIKEKNEFLTDEEIKEHIAGL